MRVLLVSEGKHEMGDARAEGALAVLVRRLLGDGAVFTREEVKSRKVRVHIRHGKGLEYQKRALAWLLYATEQKTFDAVVLVIDQDGKTERQKGIEAAQVETDPAIPRAFGVAVQMFDAWMLADEKALSIALGRTVLRQPDPERIRTPREAFAALLESVRVEGRRREIYAAVAEAVSLPLLEERCSTGFRPFAGRVRNLSHDPPEC